MDKTKIAKRYVGKVAIVTASTQGIGFTIAERLGLEGASVVVSSRKQVPEWSSIFDFSFIFWDSYALIHLGFLNSIQSWHLFLLLWLIALKSEMKKGHATLWVLTFLCCFGFWGNEIFISSKPIVSISIRFSWVERLLLNSSGVIELSSYLIWFSVEWMIEDGVWIFFWESYLIMPEMPSN